MEEKVHSKEIEEWKEREKSRESRTHLVAKGRRSHLLIHSADAA